MCSRIGYEIEHPIHIIKDKIEMAKNLISEQARSTVGARRICCIGNNILNRTPPIRASKRIILRPLTVVRADSSFQ